MKKHPSAPGRILGNLIVFFLLFAVLMPIGAAVSYFSPDPSRMLRPVTLAVLCLCGMVGGMLRGRSDGERAVFSLSISALLFLGIGMVVALILAGGKLPLAGTVNLLCFFACALLGGMLIPSGKRRKRSR